MYDNKIKDKTKATAKLKGLIDQTKVAFKDPTQKQLNADLAQVKQFKKAMTEEEVQEFEENEKLESQISHLLYIPFDKKTRRKARYEALLTIPKED